MLLTHAQTALAGSEESRFKKPLKTITRDAGYPAAPAFSKSPYSDIITKYAKSYGVPVDLAHAVVRVESNFNPKARGSAGEVGLMQIKPATARAMGYRGKTKGLYDPETNIRYGMKYLSKAHELGGGETCGTIYAVVTRTHLLGPIFAIQKANVSYGTKLSLLVRQRCL